ncbi:MAG: hypothetical protein J6Q60_05710 [Bacteroidaceae bacterium]|nr:hypothetical protein [Bacteroidaceae bacterium]
MSRFHKKVDEIEHQFNHLCEIVRTEKRSDYKKFADEVLEMLNMYCDDGNEIYIKKRVLEVNMKSILEEFIVGQDTDAGDNTSE